jgi:hypothetical protein
MRITSYDIVLFWHPRSYVRKQYFIAESVQGNNYRARQKKVNMNITYTACNRKMTQFYSDIRKAAEAAYVLWKAIESRNYSFFFKYSSLFITSESTL